MRKISPLVVKTEHPLPNTEIASTLVNHIKDWLTFLLEVHAFRQEPYVNILQHRTTNPKSPESLMHFLDFFFFASINPPPKKQEVWSFLLC